MRARFVGTGAVIGLALGVAAAQAEARPVEVDRVVATIESGEPGARVTDLVVQSEVEIAARLALAERRGVGGPTEGLRRAMVDQLTAEWLVYREAERLALADVSPEELRRAHVALAERLGGEGALGALTAQLGLVPAELDALLRRRTVVQRFVQTNVRAGIEVSDEELERAWAAGEHPFAGRPLAEVRDALRAYLVEVRFREALDHWVRALRGRSRVRVIEP